MLGFGLAIEPQLWALLFVMVRVGAAFVAAPVFGNVSVPVQVRVALSGAVAILVLGTNTIAVPPTVFALSTFLSVAAEALVGLALGFVVQIAFAAPLVAGEIIGGSMGIGFASMMDPTTGRSSPAVGWLHELATGKSPEPAGWKACATTMAVVPSCENVPLTSWGLL